MTRLHPNRLFSFPSLFQHFCIQPISSLIRHCSISTFTQSFRLGHRRLNSQPGQLLWSGRLQADIRAAVSARLDPIGQFDGGSWYPDQNSGGHRLGLQYVLRSQHIVVSVYSRVVVIGAFWVVGDRWVLYGEYYCV